ncbi:serine/threonine-protein kinase [Plesiocystis pacifica]|nr:serine/threonine-protein kinase [Plesiocystis pacifica]
MSESSEARRVGDFLIRRLIGEGGMGKVYEAEERLSRRRVALKILRPELARSESGRRAFVNEMGILARLDDPHVVRCLHCTEVDGELVMALEYLEGQTLRARMSEAGSAGLPWDTVVGIAARIAAGLEAAHAGDEPIIHRDLKPENVMLLDDGGLKVMDFGIAKVLAAASPHTTHSVGTLQYMSPEQIDAQPLTTASDLYALGLIMWEALAGRLPFESESPRKLLDMLCTQPAPPLPDAARRGLPRGVEALLEQLLEKDPKARPASAAEVRERLEVFCPAAPGPAKDNERSSTTEARVTSTPTPTPTPAPAASASAKVELKAKDTARRLDTVALVESSRGPKEIANTKAAMILAGLTVAAGLLTYLVRLLTA